MPLSRTHALACRRALVAIVVLAATLVAHALGGDFGLTPGAPFVWAQIVLVAVLVGSRDRWQVRGFGRCLALLVVLQLVGHAVMTAAPWAFGLSPHHEIAIGLAPIVFHLAAALVLAGLLTYVERALDAAVRLTRAVLRALRATRPVPASASGPPCMALPGIGLHLRRAASVRGPPWLMSQHQSLDINQGVAACLFHGIGPR